MSLGLMKQGNLERPSLMPSAWMKSNMNSYMKESEITQKLQAMLKDDTYRTLPGYSIDTDQYPDHVVPFLEDHVNYLRRHRHINPEHYLSNLRLMLKIR